MAHKKSNTHTQRPMVRYPLRARHKRRRGFTASTRFERSWFHATSWERLRRPISLELVILCLCNVSWKVYLDECTASTDFDGIIEGACQVTFKSRVLKNIVVWGYLDVRQNSFQLPISGRVSLFINIFFSPHGPHFLLSANTIVIAEYLIAFV